MFEFMNICIDMQREMLAAQQRGLDAMKHGVDGMEAMADASEAFVKAQRANADTMTNWLSFWTSKK